MLRGTVRTRTILPNFACPEAGVAACGRSNARGLDNAHNLELSHQADTTADGKILVISDERGGGVTNTTCNFQDQGTVGGDHFWALAPVPGPGPYVRRDPDAAGQAGHLLQPGSRRGLHP